MVRERGTTFEQPAFERCVEALGQGVVGRRNDRSARHFRRGFSGTLLVFLFQTVVAVLEHFRSRGVATSS